MHPKVKMMLKSSQTSPYKRMESLYETFQFNATTDYRKANVSSKQITGGLFSNFEDVQLSDEERVYLNAAALGDIGVIRMSLEAAEEDKMNVNCVDYMGRNALHLAVDSENMDAIEMLLDKVGFECIEEALLHAISKGSTKIVKVIIEHPNYMAGEDKIKRMDYHNAFFRTTEKSQFSPDITPLILSAHYNNHEMIQMFISRSHSIEKPHSISCHCTDCQVKQDYDSLKRSRSRLNAYRALASPAYMALSSQDPIMTTFELRQEMMKLAEIEKEFKREYLELVEQCMNFACEMMDLCRGTQEVEAVISDNLENDPDVRDPLGRLRMAIHYEEKKFVAHPNCQQYLTSLWYGAETGFLQSWSLLKKISLSLLTLPLMPVLCMVYILVPKSYLARAMRCPAIKFATYLLSHVCFLILLSAATFRVEVDYHPIRSTEEFLNEQKLNHQQKSSSLLKERLRPANIIITSIQISIVLWVLGLLVMEIKQVYFTGMLTYLHDGYNIMNFCVLKLYTASYTLRIIVDQWVSEADLLFSGTKIAREALENSDFETFNNHLANISFSSHEKKYFMEASRFNWTADDPEIVSDVLFAVANLISFSRTIYLMPAFEMLGPLQISFIRMIQDITRFMVLFVLVLFAFMVGLHNLYWYYGSQMIRITTAGNETKFVRATEVFEGLTHTLYTLFWAMFGQTSLSSIPLKHPDGKDPAYSDGMISSTSSTAIVEGVGMFLMAIYHVIIIIVLVNMLIAMMSHSFEDIQVDCDVEWKFARTKLWLNFVDNGSTLPVPFNIIPTPHSFMNIVRFVKGFMSGDPFLVGGGTRSTDFIRVRRERVCQENNFETSELGYNNIMQRLVRRYLFKLERQKDFDDKAKDSIPMRSDDMFGQSPELLTGGIGDSPKNVQFADAEDTNLTPAHNKLSQNTQSNLIAPPLEHPLSNSCSLARRGTIRRTPTAANRRRSSSIFPVNLSSQQNMRHNLYNLPMPNNNTGPPIQLITLPQLDGILRSQKILDMRLQNLQAQSEQLNCASGNARIKEEVEHVRILVGENLNSLASILTAVFKLQEVVTNISNNMEQWFMAQASGQPLKTVIVDEKKYSNRSSRQSDAKL